MTHRSGEFALEGPLLLDSGERLTGVRLAWESWGALTGDVVLLLHGLSHSHRALQPAAEGLWSPGGWGAPFAGPGKLIEPSHFGILSVGLLGSPFGSTSPASPQTGGEPWGERFPELSVGDLSQPLPALLDHLGIPTVRAVIGVSLGGMVALDLASKEPERIRAVATLLGPAALPDFVRRRLGMARQMLQADPDFTSQDPARARGALKRLRLTHLRDLYPRDWLARRFDDVFAAERALEQEAGAFARTFDPWAYLTLCRAMANCDLMEELRGVRGRALVVACASDDFAPPSRMQDTYHALSAAGVRARYFEIQSEAGHRAPYTEPRKLLPALAELLS
ncbi:MAG: alpha/beta fold hydrolase [Myxococcales bacterium]